MHPSVKPKNYCNKCRRGDPLITQCKQMVPPSKYKDVWSQCRRASIKGSEYCHDHPIKYPSKLIAKTGYPLGC